MSVLAVLKWSLIVGFMGFMLKPSLPTLRRWTQPVLGSVFSWWLAGHRFKALRLRRVGRLGRHAVGRHRGVRVAFHPDAPDGPEFRVRLPHAAGLTLAQGGAEATTGDAVFDAFWAVAPRDLGALPPAVRARFSNFDRERVRVREGTLTWSGPWRRDYEAELRQLMGLIDAYEAAQAAGALGVPARAAFDPEPAVRRHAVRALEAQPATAAQLQALAENPDASAQLFVARQRGAAGRTTVERLAIEADPEVAARAMGALVLGAAPARLSAILGRAWRGPGPVLAAGLRLAAARGAEIPLAAIAQAVTAGPAAQQVAVQVVRDQRWAEAAPLLIPLAGAYQTPELARAAGMALAQVGTPAVLEALLVARADGPSAAMASYTVAIDALQARLRPMLGSQRGGLAIAEADGGGLSIAEADGGLALSGD